MTKISYRNTTVDGIKIAYREAGTQGAPKLLLLHGFPTSGHMFRDLIPLLADRYHIIAPDLPGFGQSDDPAVNSFDALQTRSTASPRSSASIAMPSMSSITALRRASAWRSNIQSGSRASFRRMAMPMSMASATHGTRCRPTGKTPAQKTAPC